MDCGLLLDIVVSECTVVLELFSSENETLLIRGNGLLVLDLGLQGVNGLGWLNIERDVLPSKSLDEDLHLQGVVRRISRISRLIMSAVAMCR